MLVNVGADGYREVVTALGAPLGRLARACRKSNVLLAVTADHGMVFPSAEDKVGHPRVEACSQAPEAQRVTLVFLGLGVEELN